MTELATSSPLLLLVNGVLGITVLEALVLLGLHRFAGIGLPPQTYLLNLLSGLCLLLALRFSVLDAAWQWPALCLFASGLLHSADLLKRWRRASSGP